MEFHVSETRNIVDYYKGLDVSFDCMDFVMNRDDPHLQIVFIPDSVDETKSVGDSKYYILRRDEAELVEMEDKTEQVSEVLDCWGKYTIREAAKKARERQVETGLPLYDTMFVLRPDSWDNSERWVSCPNCNCCVEINFIPEDGTMEFRCANCGRSARNNDEGADLFDVWAHCPACDSANIQIKLTSPGGFDYYSCGDCKYSTDAVVRDIGFSRSEDSNCVNLGDGL